jgi:ribosomal protein S18 acetylase RimI-like enzyme
MMINKLTLEIIPHAVALAKELHGFGTFGQNGPAFDWDFCINQFMWVERNPRYYAHFAANDEGVYVGGVVGHVDTFFFSPEYMALEDAWYVREGVTDRTKIAVKLMRGFMGWALDDMKAVLVQTGDIAAINSLAVDSIYRHLGFERFGTVYKYQRK